MSTTIPFTTTGMTPHHVQPVKSHHDDAAYDLFASQDRWCGPGEQVLVPTGLRLAIPQGFAGLILPRSGNALKHGFTVLNSPGLIDPGYRGEIGVLIHKPLTASDVLDLAEQGDVGVGRSADRIERGDRIAQLLIVRTADTNFIYWPTTEWDSAITERGEGGFGSTGR